MGKLLDYVFKPEMQEILDRLSNLFDVHIVFLSPTGETLRVGEDRPICRFCRLLQRRLGYHHICQKLDRRQRRKAIEKGKPLYYQCHALLHEAFLPVYVAGRLAGFIMLGQFRSTDAPPRSILRKWERQEGTDELQQAYSEIPRYTPEKIRSILGLNEMLVKFMTDLHLVIITSQNPLEPVLFYMRENLSERLTLDEVAAFACRSPSTLSHQFKRIMGKSFKEVEAEMIVEEAASYFRAEPGITVAEVAGRLGFEDGRYFSRFFKKQTGLPPATYARSG